MIIKFNKCTRKTLSFLLALLALVLQGGLPCLATRPGEAGAPPIKISTVGQNCEQTGMLEFAGIEDKVTFIRIYNEMMNYCSFKLDPKDFDSNFYEQDLFRVKIFLQVFGSGLHNQYVINNLMQLLEEIAIFNGFTIGSNTLYQND